MAIPFTQYLLPNGWQRQVVIDMPEDVETKAQRIIAQGYHFDAEILTTGFISFACVSNDDEENTVAIELCANGPIVMGAVTKLIDAALREIETLAPTTEEDDG